MARATHVKAARRRYSEDETGIDGGIKKGQSYYWWKFKRGGKRFSLTPPRASQLTQSAFYGTLADLQDRINALEPNESLVDEVPSLSEALQELGEECQSSLDNMPEGLQQGPTGELLQERIDACQGAADELDGIDLEAPEPEEFETPEREDSESDEEFDLRVADERKDHEEDQARVIEEHWESVLDEVSGVDLSIG
jgi:hypothetical protein